jgi:hypothetical protein
MRLWSAWTLLITSVLYLNPLGHFGAVELAACLGPLLLAADLRLRREIAFVVGMPAITLLALLDPADDSLVRLVTAWLVYAVGVWLMARMIDGRQELEMIAGRVAFLPRDPEALHRFKNALEREVGRARRHDKSFVVLSIAADPHSLADDQPDLIRNEVLGALAERRARFEIQSVLSEELHVYADVALSRDAVLALVPEVEPRAVEPLVRRLRESIRERLGIEIQVGLAGFPEDAISAEELVLLAERSRKASKLRPIQKPGAVVDEKRVAGRSNESQA